MNKNRKLIIFEPHCSVIYQLITMITEHEGFDFELDVWNEEKALLDKEDLLDRNLAISKLIFDDKKNLMKI